MKYPSQPHSWRKMGLGTLTPLSWFYQIGVCLRHWMYDCKIFVKNRAPLPVISVGNIMAGGVGKTQVVLLLAEELKNSSLAILSRGYRGGAESATTPVLVDINKHSVEEVGDEPWVLASRLCVPVFVSKHRLKSVHAAEKRGARLVILDDGMQYLKLHRDFEIIVIDGKTPFGAFLPKGRLREDPRRLQTADMILYVGEPEEKIERSVSRWTAAPQVVAKIAVKGMFWLDGTPLEEELRGKTVGIFCGIGNPSRFRETVEALGAKVIVSHFSSDHRMMGRFRLEKFALSAKEKGAFLLLCTEKDKVKLSKKTQLSLPIGWIQTGLEIVKNRSAWIEAVAEIKSLTGAAL